MWPYCIPCSLQLVSDNASYALTVQMQALPVPVTFGVIFVFILGNALITVVFAPILPLERNISRVMYSESIQEITCHYFLDLVFLDIFLTTISSKNLRETLILTNLGTIKLKSSPNEPTKFHGTANGSQQAVSLERNLVRIC